MRNTSVWAAAIAAIVLSVSSAPGQTIPSCDTTCSTAALSVRKVCNEELSPETLEAEVLDFTPNVFDAAGNLVDEGTTAQRMCIPNVAVSRVLIGLDIDGDEVTDITQDTDGDGLPDNWEQGGVEALSSNGERPDRVVFFPAPTAIVPGTPPTPIFSRLGVATSALAPDTDGDGLSDFVEVFGLMFIDEDRNGLLDDGLEWSDLNGDGLPSPGEFPIDNSGQQFPGFPALRHDFDGFVFTDPINRDTDGDGFNDGDDNDPLINPRSFGSERLFNIRFNAEGNDDIDQDGLGNGMDMGNDLLPTEASGITGFQAIDNPENIVELLDLFRKDLLRENVVPEAAIEDLLGADWDGNGLWRTTDVRTWFIVIDDPAIPGSTPPANLFTVAGDPLYTPQTFAEISACVNDRACTRRGSSQTNYGLYGGRGVGLGWQDLLQPTGATPFIPDDRVWAILYSWRMPGFDIDGDGFIGVPNATNTATYLINGEDFFTAVLEDAAGGSATVSSTTEVPTIDITTPIEDTPTPFDDRITPATAASVTVNADGSQLDGVIQLDGAVGGLPCGFGATGATGMILLVFAGLSLTLFLRRA